MNILLRLFLNPGNSAHLRGLAEEFDESTNAVRLELNRFEEAGMLTSEAEGNKKLYKANCKHPLFKDIHNILLKHTGVDQIIEQILNQVGDLDKVYLTGDYARGRDTGVIDLVLIGDIDQRYLLALITKVEPVIKKKIRFVKFTLEEYKAASHSGIGIGSGLLIWENSKSN